MRGLAVILLALVLCGTVFGHAVPGPDYTSYYTASPDSNASKHIFLYGIPFPGHIFPLLAHAELLAERGYTVTVSTVTSLQSFIERHKHPKVQYVPAGECKPDMEKWDEAKPIMNEMVHFGDSTKVIFDWINLSQSCFGYNLFALLLDAQSKTSRTLHPYNNQILPPIDLMVIDIVTVAAIDIARALRIKFIVNNADLNAAIPTPAITAWDDTPLIFETQSVHEYNYGIEVRSWTKQYNALNAQDHQIDFTSIFNIFEQDPHDVVQQEPSTSTSSVVGDILGGVYKRFHHYLASLIGRVGYPAARLLFHLIIHQTTAADATARRGYLAKLAQYITTTPSWMQDAGILACHPQHGKEERSRYNLQVESQFHLDDAFCEFIALNPKEYVSLSKTIISSPPAAKQLPKEILQHRQELIQQFITATITPLDTIGVINNMFIIQNTLWGIEYPRPLPPNIIAVGPCIPQSNQDELSTSTPAMEQQLAWLSSQSGDDAPVLYMSFGTLGHVSKPATVELFRGFASLIRETPIRILWKLTASYVELVVDAYLESGVHIHGFFDAVEMIPRGRQYLETIQGRINHYLLDLQSSTEIIPSNRWLLTDWVFSQLGVLNHSSTRIFLSHCGINSAQESVLSKKFTICIPLFGDQLDMINRLHDANIGIPLFKQFVNQNSINLAVKYALYASTTPTFHHTIRKLAKTYELAGGSKRAVEYIEFILHYGEPIDRPVTANRVEITNDEIAVKQYRYTEQFDQGIFFEPIFSIPFQSYLQFYRIDVILFWVFVAVVLFTLIFGAFRAVYCFCWKPCACRQRHSHSSHHNQPQETNDDIINSKGKSKPTAVHSSKAKKD